MVAPPRCRSSGSPARAMGSVVPLIGNRTIGSEHGPYKRRQYLGQGNLRGRRLGAPPDELPWEGSPANRTHCTLPKRGVITCLFRWLARGHRTLAVHAFTGLERAISVDVVHPHLRDRGWSFDTDFPGATGDTFGGRSHLQPVYPPAAPDTPASSRCPFFGKAGQRGDQSERHFEPQLLRTIEHKVAGMCECFA